MPYRTVAASAEFEERVKGSRFVARVLSVADEAAARAARDDARAREPDASHHCLAWRVGERMAADDDGEPGGTAGRPMLELILKRDLDRVAIVCSRWFGGTKLGAGGLLRAYGGTAAKALDRAGERTVHERVRTVAHVPYPWIDVVHRALDAWPEAVKEEPSYGPDGARLAVALRADAVATLRAALAERTAGDVRLELDDTEPEPGADLNGS